MEQGTECVIFISFMVITQIAHVCALRDPYSFEGSIFIYKYKLFIYKEIFKMFQNSFLPPKWPKYEKNCSETIFF